MEGRAGELGRRGIVVATPELGHGENGGHDHHQAGGQGSPAPPGLLFGAEGHDLLCLRGEVGLLDIRQDTLTGFRGEVHLFHEFTIGVLLRLIQGHPPPPTRA